MQNAVYLALFGCFLGGCGLTPHPSCLKEAPSAALERMQENALADISFIDSQWLDQTWWHLFADPQLDDFIYQAIANHPSMREAAARIASSQAEANKRRGGLFPSLSLEFEIARVHFSKNGLLGLLNQVDPAFPLTFTQKGLGLICQYELDLWKKIRNEIISSLNKWRATVIEAYSAQLSLAISVAQSYFQHQIAAARCSIARDLLGNREKILSLMAIKNKNALENQLRVYQAKNGVSEAKIHLSVLQQESASSNFALQALLADQFMTPILLADTSAGLSHPFPLPKALPLDLLAHRPDIWAQKWRIEAANCQVCIARAHFYPNVNLLGLIGYEALVPNPLLVKDSLAGLLFGPAINLPIFEGGALVAELDYRKQQYAQEIAKYDELVLNAVKEVLDAIDAVQRTSERHTFAVEAEKTAKSNMELARLRAKKVDSKLESIAFENQWLQAGDTALQALHEGLNARLALIRALGGGL